MRGGGRSKASRSRGEEVCGVGKSMLVAERCESSFVQAANWTSQVPRDEAKGGGSRPLIRDHVLQEVGGSGHPH